MRLKLLVESPNMTNNPNPKTAMDSPAALPLRGNFEACCFVVVISPNPIGSDGMPQSCQTVRGHSLTDH